MFEKIILGIVSILVIMGIAWIFSDNRKKVSLRTVSVGVITPILLLIFFQKVPIGIDILNAITDAFLKVISFSQSGIDMVFGTKLNSLFIIGVMMPVVFMCALISLLRYWRVIDVLAFILTKTLCKMIKISKLDSLSIISNGILAGSEAPIFYQSSIHKMTKSEVFTMITLAFSTTALSILPAYHGMGVPMKFLIENNILALFTGLVIAKIMCPETEKTEDDVKLEKSEDSSFIGAIGSGAEIGWLIAVKVSAMLIAVVSLVALANYLLGFVHLSLAEIFGWVLLPIIKLLGVPYHYQHLFTNLLAQKIYANEFVSFGTLQASINTLPLVPKMQIVALLQNFANISVCSIEIGAILALTKSTRVHDMVTKNIWKMLLAGILSSLMLTGIITLAMA